MKWSLLYRLKSKFLLLQNGYLARTAVVFLVWRWQSESLSFLCSSAVQFLLELMSANNCSVVSFVLWATNSISLEILSSGTILKPVVDDIMYCHWHLGCNLNAALFFFFLISSPDFSTQVGKQYLLIDNKNASEVAEWSGILLSIVSVVDGSSGHAINAHSYWLIDTGGIDVVPSFEFARHWD